MIEHPLIFLKLISFLESFNKYAERKECPIECEQLGFHYDKSDARFIHNPPKGVEPVILNNNSHLLELVQTLTAEELDEYVE